MWVCVLGRCCLCCVAAPCSGPSPAPPLEKDIPGCKRLCSKLSEYTESQAQAEKKPKIPKFPFPKYMTFPYFTFQDHVPLSLVFKLCGLSADRQHQWSLQWKPVWKGALTVSDLLSGSSFGLTSSKSRRDTPSACWIRGRAHEI